jgi:hypothetical protein
MMETLRRHLVSYSSLYGFLFAYFLTTVFAAVLYQTPWGEQWPRYFISRFDWGNFRQPFGLGYWTLILSPFIAVPVVAIITRAVAEPIASNLSRVVHDIPPAMYSAITLALYAFVSLRFYEADALGKLLSGTDAMQAVAHRFALQAEIGHPVLIALLSGLVFLSIYSGVKAERRGGWFWLSAFAMNLIAMLSLLTLLNMKWPIVLFFLTIGLQVLATARRYPIIKSIVVGACAFGCYLLISVILLRVVPLPAMQSAAAPTSTSAPKSQKPSQPAASQTTKRLLSATDEDAQSAIDFAGDAISASGRNAPQLLIVLVNRMAMAVPYYWDIFTTEGQACGSFLDRVVFQKPDSCHPSEFVYLRMFRSFDPIEKATAPAAAHIYEYAREGWPGAIVALGLVGIIIGCFMSFSAVAATNDTIATAFIMGGPSGYLLSQLPVESIFIYDHGIVWWSALILIVSAISSLTRAHRMPIL